MTEAEKAQVRMWMWLQRDPLWRSVTLTCDSQLHCVVRLNYERTPAGDSTQTGRAPRLADAIEDALARAPD